MTTYTRLPDENGQIVIDQYSEFDNKDTPPATMRYTLASGFNADRELIDFLRAITAASARVGADAPFTDLPADTVNAIKGAPAYGATAAFKGSERVDGKNCDRYSYTRNHNGQTETGDIWLSPSVPFGLVKQKMSMADAVGQGDLHRRDHAGRFRNEEIVGASASAVRERFVIEVTRVVKRYGATTVLNEATFRVAAAQLTTIVGPSGCGKSTMLRCLNRLERFDDGKIKIENVELHGTATQVAFGR